MSCITVLIVHHPLLSSWNHTPRYRGDSECLETPVGGDIFCQNMRLSNSKWLFYYPEISAGEWRSDHLALRYWSNPNVDQRKKFMIQSTMGGVLYKQCYLAFSEVFVEPVTSQFIWVWLTLSVQPATVHCEGNESSCCCGKFHHKV